MTAPSFARVDHPARRTTLRRLLVLAGTPLAACAPARPRGGPQEARPGASADAPPGVARDTRRGMFDAADGALPFLLSLPREAKASALVVHLHDLGEDLDTPNQWCDGWLAAGYAVLQLQIEPASALPQRHPRGDPPPAPDAERGGEGNTARRPPPSERSQTWTDADLPDASGHFSPPALAQQSRRIEAALADTLQHIRRGEARFSGLSGLPWALSGCGMGAWLALTQPRTTAMRAPSALFLLSPTLPASTPDDASSFALGATPALLVTGGEDRNDYRPQSTAALREALFSRLPRGDKFLLRLDGGSHAVLSGQPARPQAGPTDAGPGPGANGGPPQGGGGSRGRGKPGGGSGGDPGGGEAGPALRASPRQQALELEIARRVGRAFFSAYVRDDPLARQWLQQDAPRWLSERALFAQR